MSTFATKFVASSGTVMVKVRVKADFPLSPCSVHCACHTLLIIVPAASGISICRLHGLDADEGTHRRSRKCRAQGGTAPSGCPARPPRPAIRRSSRRLSTSGSSQLLKDGYGSAPTYVEPMADVHDDVHAVEEGDEMGCADAGCRRLPRYGRKRPRWATTTTMARMTDERMGPRCTL